MKKLFLMAALSMLPLCALAQERLDSAVVSATRAGINTPVAYENVGRETLRQANPQHSLPMALNLLPSVVTHNEGGTGLGNSSMTIRGSKGSQINVTLNGITLNDAESQEVFWVNIPSLTSLLSGVQVQRGLGTSASGAGAFGASINMNTAFVQAHPSAVLEESVGSYGTVISSAAISSGLTKRGFYANLAWNIGHTDGYIYGADVNSASLFAVLGWMGAGQSIRLTYLMGDQRSGITWDGISPEQYAQDRRYNGAVGNTDNYGQHHLQLNYTRVLRPFLIWTSTVNYTRGDGYDEYHKRNKKLAYYGVAGGGRADISYRKRMDNDLWVMCSNLRYKGAQWDFTGGVNAGFYRGAHWGEVLFHPSDSWYDNQGRKWDASAFLRAEWRPLNWLTAYAEAQYRFIHYRFWGVDDDWLEYGAQDADRLDYIRRWNFFNPRAGVTARWGRHKVYASAAIGHREPGRGDIKENIKGTGASISPEAMLDLELGYHFTGERLEASAGLYAMEYKDMLLETGRLSTSGYAIKENVPRAWRRGVELQAAWQALRWLRLDGNVTFSLNEIADYTSYVPFEDYSDTHPVHYGRTTMLLSPGIVAMGRIQLMPWKGSLLSLDGKYVGKQYLDNSMRESLAVPAYFVASLGLGQDFRLGEAGLSVGAYIDNLLNNLYYASGWRYETYNPADGTISTGVGIYPQAPRHFMLKARLTF